MSYLVAATNKELHRPPTFRCIPHLPIIEKFEPLSYQKQLEIIRDELSMITKENFQNNGLWLPKFTSKDIGSIEYIRLIENETVDLYIDKQNKLRVVPNQSVLNLYNRSCIIEICYKSMGPLDKSVGPLDKSVGLDEEKPISRVIEGKVFF